MLRTVVILVSILLIAFVQLFFVSRVSIYVGGIHTTTTVVGGPMGGLIGGEDRSPAYFCFGRLIEFNCWWIQEPDLKNHSEFGHTWSLRACVLSPDETAISQGGRSWIISNSTGRYQTSPNQNCNVPDCQVSYWDFKHRQNGDCAMRSSY